MADEQNASNYSPRQPLETVAAILDPVDNNNNKNSLAFDYKFYFILIEKVFVLTKIFYILFFKNIYMKFIDLKYFTLLFFIRRFI